VNRPNGKLGRKKREAPGPKPEIVKINSYWQDAVKLLLTKKKSANGWPK
jgi:hypothetical protein